MGIIVGILYLWLSGDLDALLGVATAAGSGAGGIKALLGGVALAMISSRLSCIGFQPRILFAFSLEATSLAGSPARRSVSIAGIECPVTVLAVSITSLTE